MTNREQSLLKRLLAGDTIVVNVRLDTKLIDEATRLRRYLYIGRPSRWGNPFVIGKDGNRAEVIAKHRQHLDSRGELLARIRELKGLALGCYCAPLACHGDHLATLANQT